MHPKTLLAVTATVWVVVVVGLIGSMHENDYGAQHPVELKQTGYSNWLCYIGWKEEGCGAGGKYIPAVIKDLQDDHFDKDYDDVFGNWEKNKGFPKNIAERIAGCDGIIGSGKALNACGKCEKPDSACKIKRGYKVEYWHRAFAMTQVPVQRNAQKVWGEHNGFLDLVGRAAFHTVAQDTFSSNYIGLLKVDTEDLYEFTVTSVDGSRLFVDNRLIVNNDGVHRQRSKSGVVALLKGYHNVRVEYFNGGKRDPVLKVEWRPRQAEKNQIVSLVLPKSMRLAAPPLFLSAKKKNGKGNNKKKGNGSAKKRNGKGSKNNKKKNGKRNGSNKNKNKKRNSNNNKNKKRNSNNKSKKKNNSNKNKNKKRKNNVVQKGKKKVDKLKKNIQRQVGKALKKKTNSKVVQNITKKIQQKINNRQKPKQNTPKDKKQPQKEKRRRRR